MENEVWKDVKGYEGSYEVSNYGNVKSLTRLINRGQKGSIFFVGRLISYFISVHGYKISGLCKNGKRKNIPIHRLVCINFIDNIEKKSQVNHINGIKYDNRVENLEWSTAAENICHSWKMGLSKMAKGANSKCSKKIINIETNEIFGSIGLAAISIGFTGSYLNNMLLGNNKNKTNMRYFEN